MCGALVCIGMNAIYYTRVVFGGSIGPGWHALVMDCVHYMTVRNRHGGGTVALYAPYRTHSWIWKTWGEGLVLNVGFTTRVL